MVASAQEEEYHGPFAQSGCPDQGISRVTGDAVDGSNLISSIEITEIRFPSRMRVGGPIIAVASMRVRAAECWNRLLESCCRVGSCAIRGEESACRG